MLGTILILVSLAFAIYAAWLYIGTPVVDPVPKRVWAAVVAAASSIAAFIWQFVQSAGSAQ